MRPTCCRLTAVTPDRFRSKLVTLLRVAGVEVSPYEPLSNTDDRRTRQPKEEYFQPTRKIALAISGGVDSMALAYLASRLQKQAPAQFNFIAFVIDHGLRPTSHQEALVTVKRLEQLGLTTAMETVRWNMMPREGLETKARAQRYRTLTEMAQPHRPRALLLAHHQDDQAETVLLRIVSNYMGTGPKGMLPVTRMPESHGVMHIHANIPVHSQERDERLPKADLPSADPGMPVCRPLLNICKAELIQTCREANVDWIEDESNSDPALTMRNTIRSSLKNDELPHALRTEQLLNLGSRIRERIDTKDRKADNVLSRFAIDWLDHFAGVISFNVGRFHSCSDATWDSLSVPRKFVFATVVQKLAHSVSPKDDIAIDLALEISRRLFNKQSSDFTAASVHFVRNPSYPNHWGASRAPMTDAEITAESFKINPGPKGTRWLLWDGRWWMRFRAKVDMPDTELRPFRPGLLQQLREDAGSGKLYPGVIEALARHCPGKIRFGLPAIVDPHGRLLGLPTLGWWSRSARLNWLECEGLLYKRVSIPDQVPRRTPHDRIFKWRRVKPEDLPDQQSSPVNFSRPVEISAT